MLNKRALQLIDLTTGKKKVGDSLPKILESVRSDLLKTARKQLQEKGYAKTTIRSVAAECGIAVGTVYNYFSSKDMLIASFVSEDWHETLETMRSHPSDDAEDFFRCIYDSLITFSVEHASLFSDPDAVKIFSAAFFERHGMLRGQLAALIRPFCEGHDDPDFLSQFAAESLLTWTMAKVPFSSIYSVIQKIIS